MEAVIILLIMVAGVAAIIGILFFSDMFEKWAFGEDDISRSEDSGRFDETEKIDTLV